MKATDIKYLLIHCSDSTWGNAAAIRAWHTNPEFCPHGFKKAKGCPHVKTKKCDPAKTGNGWSRLGYHYVIGNSAPTFNALTKPLAANDGLVEKGLAHNQVGIHALDYNARSLGICLIGRGSRDFSEAQMAALRKLVKDLMKQYGIPVKNVIGHYEIPKSGGKTCPNMDMATFRKSLA